MGKKITDLKFCIVEYRLFFTPQNWRFWSSELSGTYTAIHWHVAFWSKRRCLVKQSFSVAILGLQNLFLFGLAGYSTISKSTFALRPRRRAAARALSSASLGLNPRVTSTGFLSTESVKQFRAHSTAAAFLHSLIKRNHKLDYLVFTAFETYSRLIQKSVHCFLSIHYLNISTELYTEMFSSYRLQIFPQKYFCNLIHQESPSECFIWETLQSFDHYKISRWYQCGSWSTPS